MIRFVTYPLRSAKATKADETRLMSDYYEPSRIDFREEGDL